MCIRDSANRAHEALEGKGNDRRLRNAHQHVLVDTDVRLTHPLLAALIDEEYVDRHIHRAAHAGELRAVAHTLNGQVRNRAGSGGAAAALEGPCAAGLRQRATAVFGILHGLGAVSYTHLDVYKRQALATSTYSTSPISRAILKPV